MMIIDSRNLRAACGVNPSFGDRFEFKFIVGIRSLRVSVYNKRTVGKTILISAGK